MKKFKVCFVGIGSIAKRHIKNLHAICEQFQIQLQIDAVRRVRKESIETIYNFINNVFYSVDDLVEKYDAIFITNPTEMHMDTLNSVKDKSNNFFIEKPISSLTQIEKAKKFIEQEGCVYYVACPLRYNAVIQYIKNNIDLNSIISVRSISSSHLPDWRPGIDYRDTYSAHKELGGGVSIDLIHEWDYLTYLFGKPLALKSFIGKKSNLEINSDDYAIYMAEYQNKIVELHLDYFGRNTIRKIELITKEDTIIGDIANNKLTFLSSNKEIDFKEERDDFQRRELIHFLEIIKGKIKNDSDIKHAINVMNITQGDI